MKKVFHTKTHNINKLLDEAADLERIGEYETALELLEEHWPDKSKIPDISGFTQAEGAEFFLRCGALIGYVGSLRQIKSAQDQSNDLLFGARNIFLNLFDSEKAAECENFLALAYYRKGEYAEASIWAEESFSGRLEADHEIRLNTHIVMSLILLAERRFQEVILYLKKVKNDFKNASPLLSGSFATNLGLAYKNLNKLDSALEQFNLAQVFHNRSKHKPYLATVENNLAQVYILKRNYSSALIAVNKSIDILIEVNDRLRAAIGFETKAEIFWGLQDNEQALEFIEQAIKLLIYCDNSGVLSQIYLTKSKILVNSRKIGPAALAFSKSYKYALNAGREQADKIQKEYEFCFLNQNPPTVKIFSEKVKTKPDKIPQEIQLDLPAGISQDQQLFGVWVCNDFFAEYGLAKDYLAVGVRAAAEKGDLVAVEAPEDEVILGFYEQEFGMICIENHFTEPELFDTGEAKVMGKIVGFSDARLNSENRFTVQLLKLKSNQEY